VRDWQFDVIFWLGIIGALVMLFSDPLGITVRPEVVTLFGVMLAFVYQQKQRINNDKEDSKKHRKRKEDEDDG
jgi:hypothetical protein